MAAAIQNSTGRTINNENTFHGGLRGIAFHPDFRSNGKFYVSVVEDRPANPAQFIYLSDAAAIEADSVLVEWSVNPDTFEVDEGSYRGVFRVGIPEYDHPIKQIGFNPVAKVGNEDYELLYIGHGDGSRESSVAGDGEGTNALGKILRINPLLSGDDSYSVPATNPFVGNPDMLDEVYCLGHRNPHHMAFLPDGQLLVTEVGRDNIDEANLIVAGGNYGWSEREGAFVHPELDTVSNGITALPDDDARNDFIYLVIQFGHTGAVGDTFTSQGLAGGFMMNNGSELDNQFFYVDFVKSGQLFHSTMNSIFDSQVQGAPDRLTVAQTYEAGLSFDHDESVDTGALKTAMPVENRVKKKTGSGL